MQRINRKLHGGTYLVAFYCPGTSGWAGSPETIQSEQVDFRAVREDLSEQEKSGIKELLNIKSMKEVNLP